MERLDRLFYEYAYDALHYRYKKTFFEFLTKHLYKSPYAKGLYYHLGLNELEFKSSDVDALVVFNLIPSNTIDCQPTVCNARVVYYDFSNKKHILKDDGTLKDFFENDARGCIDYSNYDRWINDEPEYDD